MPRETNVDTNVMTLVSPNGNYQFKLEVSNTGTLKTYKMVSGSWVEVSSIDNT